ncbi:hypothetical protein Tco_1575321 [Tanacetum coccineum]
MLVYKWSYSHSSLTKSIPNNKNGTYHTLVRFRALETPGLKNSNQGFGSNSSSSTTSRVRHSSPTQLVSNLCAMQVTTSCCHVVRLAKGTDRPDMSNSDELRHTDNTTLVPPRLPDTLPQVYHRRLPTLELLIFSSVPSFSPTIRRTVRMSVLPIEPNLAEHARISAINLNDYQLDPLTPPPSPSSPFTMATYQRMIAETDPT